MEVPTAGEMSNRLNSLVGQIARHNLVTPASISNLKEMATRLEKLKRSKEWAYSFGNRQNIEFTPTQEDAKVVCIPRLTADIVVSNASEVSPFRRLTLTIEIVDIRKNPITRWHIDQANEDQNGPLFHLQGGGHWAGSSKRDDELPIKSPRWAHPPLDIVLAVEMVIANFYPIKWVDGIDAGSDFKAGRGGVIAELRSAWKKKAGVLQRK